MMLKNQNKKSSWFMEISRCRYSGLAITHPETLVCSEPGSDFCADIARLGQNILLVKAHGYVSSFAESEFLSCIDAFTVKYFKSENKIIVIEDYADLTGGDAESRKKYIAYFSGNPLYIAGIFYNLPPIYKLSVNLATKLHLSAARAHAVSTYEQAIDLAGKLIKQDNASQKADGNKRRLSNEDAGEDAGRMPDMPGRSTHFEFLFRIFAKLKTTHLFFTQTAKQQLKKQFSDELIKFIATIDWHNPGMPPVENIMKGDVSSQNVFDAISFVKSEIDMLMEERDAAETVLRESESRYRLLVKHAKAGFLEYDYQTGQIISVNDEFIHMIGYSEKELLGSDPLAFLTEESRKIFKQRVLKRISRQAISQEVAYQVLTKDNGVRWLLLNANITYRNKCPEKASIVVTDITPLKETENRLLEYQEKLRRLSIRLSMIEEDQRRSMASRLHETIGQELFVMQLQLAALEKSLENPGLFPGLKQINDQLLKIIKETKSLTFDLSPPVLYDLGFQEAVTTLARIVERKHNIQVRTFFEGDMDVIGDEIKVILYRNIKELIHNTVKHAGARNISICFKNSQSELHVECGDDGAGFDAEGFIVATAAHDGFGLFDIKEKLNHLGGNLIINSTPGQGTSVCMKVPLHLQN